MLTGAAEWLNRKTIVLGLYGVLAAVSVTILVLRCTLLLGCAFRRAAERLLGRMQLHRRSLEAP